MSELRVLDRHPESDRLEAIEIVTRHFPEIPLGNVYKVWVDSDEIYVTVTVFRYAEHHETGGRYIDEHTLEVAVLPPLSKTFPISGLVES